MRKIFKKRIYLLVLLGTLVAAATAVGYFTTTGSGTGQATVGTAGSWTVSETSSSGSMFPGSGSTTIQYSVTNSGSGYQKLSTTTTAVAADGSGNVTSHGTSVSGCLASWFSPANSPPSATDVAPGASVSGSVVITMSDSGTNQNACQGVTPDIAITAG